MPAQNEATCHGAAGGPRPCRRRSGPIPQKYKAPRSPVPMRTLGCSDQPHSYGPVGRARSSRSGASEQRRQPPDRANAQW